MPEHNDIPFHAFLEQIANWELTLTRESKKLKQLRKITSNKFHLNSIEIALIGIESELIQYKKIKEKKYLDSQYVVEDYTLFSKRFMNIMEKIAEAADQDRYKNTPNLEADTSNIEGREATTKNKHFLQETFSHKISKQPSKKKNKSCIQTKKELSYLLKSKKKARQSVRGLESKLSGLKQNNKNSLNFNKLSLEEQEDLSDIRYQLKQIKSMMLQIQNEIKFHSHDDIEKEVSKLAYNHKKVAIEIKNLKDDNQFILARLNNIKDQINLERKAQTEMIRLFESGKENKANISELAKSKNLAEEVSEWVKVRI